MVVFSVIETIIRFICSRFSSTILFLKSSPYLKFKSFIRNSEFSKKHSTFSSKNSPQSVPLVCFGVLGWYEFTFNLKSLQYYLSASFIFLSNASYNKYSCKTFILSDIKGSIESKFNMNGYVISTSSAYYFGY